MKPDPNLLQPGDRRGNYEVIRANDFGTVLPRAVIVAGPNTGVEVYLTSPYKDPT